MLKLFIAEDESNTLDGIIQIVKNYIPETVVSGHAKTVSDAVHFLSQNSIDLALLDINFPDGTGFDILKNLNTINFKIIFITAFEKFALQAIKFSASDYLLKPINPKELIEAVNKIQKESQIDSDTMVHLKTLLSNMNDKESGIKKIVLKTQERIHVINTSEIVRCESDGSYTTFFLVSDKKIIVSKSLSEYEELLIDYHFLRVHKSHLVNIAFIESYEKSSGGYLLMRNNTQIPVSVRKKDFVIHALENL